MNKYAILLFFLAVPSWAGYNGYDYRQKISILHAQVPNTDQTNFPVLISTTLATLATTANGGHVKNSSGFDIVFSTRDDCGFLLNWDTETYTASSGNLIVWVKHPLVTTASDATMYICYGNSSITTYQGVSASAWDADYKGVWHLPDGSSLQLSDSTNNGNTLTNNNTVAATAAQIDGGASFTGSSSQHLSRASASLAFAAQTFSIWVKPTSLANAYTGLISQTTVGGAETVFTVYVKSDGTMAVYMDVGGGTGGNMFYDGTGATTLTTGNWYYISVSYDSTNGIKSYVNGALDKSVAPAGTHNSPTGTFGIGTDEGFPTGRYLTGAEDEARVSDISRSADWVKTEYNNQSSPSTFYTIGPETTTNGNFFQVFL